MTSAATITVGRMADGVRLKVEGRGTLKESPSVGEFAARVLESGVRLVVELSACEYLDSTFLGCLVGLHRQHGCHWPPRFALAGPPEVCRKLLGPNHLEKLFHRVDPGPEPETTDLAALPALAVAGPQLGHHVRDCHQELAEVDGPNREAFDRIARALSTDLRREGESPRSEGDPAG